MRTTPTLDDDLLVLAARQAKLRGVSLGRVGTVRRRALVQRLNACFGFTLV